ncbi:PHP domain-containing protein [Candidatus Woesearchaeota archaeon]|nr:PHP domain-containing protein [Candidatus Woesearchaeota archaeon]
MKYDMHVHTNYSLCSNLKPETVLKLAKKKGLDGIAVADHNEIKGALKVKKLNKDKDFEVVIGSEIKTDKGDILAYYINKQIRSKELSDVLDEIKQQNGLAVIAHPYRLLPHLRFRCPIQKIKDKVDGVECLNSRASFLANNLALTVSDKLGIAKLAGSDAHFAFEIGKAFTVFDGDLRKAIKNKKTKVEGSSFTGFIGGTMSFFLKRINLIFKQPYGG